MLRRAREHKRADYLSVLESESNRLAQLIQDLLDLSKIESSKGIEQDELINVLSILATTVHINKKLAERKKIGLMIPSSEQSLFVQANGKQLEQVFTNLLANAINYTPDGGQVFSRWGISHDIIEYPIWISISDTGYGIVPDELPFIFGRFYRGTNGTEHNVPGTGLGLAICKAIVEQHKGTIEVQSELRKGSIFTVRLPFAIGQSKLEE